MNNNLAGSLSHDSYATHETIWEMFQNANRILVVSHVRPDGDAVGSLLGLGLALIKAGKDVRMVLEDGVPATFRYLAGSQQIHRSAKLDPQSPYDLVIVVDCSDLRRVGSALGERQPDLNIDHHITNLNFARVNLIVPTQVATSAIIAEYLRAWGLEFDQPIASALLTGIVTDTIGFRTSNMTSEALRLSALMVEYGANLPELYNLALINKTFEAARYWGMGLSQLEREELPDGGTLVWTRLTLNDRRSANYSGNDDADLVNLLSTIESDIALIFVEQNAGHVKISWRARTGLDVSKIALQFGGGGHAAAAGADITGALEAVEKQVLAATRAMLVQAYQQLNMIA